MCRRFREFQEKEKEDKATEETGSRYDEQIDRFFGRLNLASDSLAEVTKKVVAQTKDFDVHDKTKWKELVHTLNNEMDTYLNRPYQTRTEFTPNEVNETEFKEPRFMRPGSFFDVFSDGGTETPYGLYPHTSPTPREYNTCVKKNGVSLWDSKGTWRCLFPNSAVPPKFLEYKRQSLSNQILTKEDFEAASRESNYGVDGGIDLGAKGLFFKHFEDLLKWKDAAYEGNRRQREERRNRFFKSFQKPSTDLSQSSSASPPEYREKEQAVSWSSGSTTTTDPDSNQIVMVETKTEYFEDGTSVTNTVTKRKSIGADKWESVEENSQRGDKKGWFWN